MNIKFHENMNSGAKGFFVGYAVIEGLQIERKNEALKKEIKTEINDIMNRFSAGTSEMYQYSPIVGMRDIFKAKGIDPTKSRPSAEALLKRIIDGKGLYTINTVVDCNNLGSIKYALPMGVYSLESIVGDVIFKFGENEYMETMAKGKLNVNGILVSKDSEKLFGSPVSDSPYAMITEKVKSVLLLVYGPANAGEEYVREATRFTANKIALYAKGQVAEIDVKKSE